MVFAIEKAAIFHFEDTIGVGERRVIVGHGDGLLRNSFCLVLAVCEYRIRILWRFCHRRNVISAAAARRVEKVGQSPERDRNRLRGLATNDG